MFSRDRWSEIFESIKNNKLRTFLSGFTVTLGILIFTVLFGLGNGLQNSFMEFFVDDATNTIWLYPGQTSKPYKGFPRDRRIQFENSDLEDIKSRFGNQLEFMSPRIYGNGLVRYGLESNSYSSQAVSPGHQKVEKTLIMKGRYINENDVLTKNKVIVLGRLVVKDLFPKDVNPIGEYVDMDGSSYKVIGVFQDDGGDNQERMVFIPYTTQQLVLKNSNDIDRIIVGFNLDLGYVGAVRLTKQIEEFMRTKHSIHPDDDNGLYIRNQAESVKETLQFVNVLKLVVTFVGLGTLLAGIIGISNIMVFVVKERTKELGIRKALGASPGSVIGMVLQESVFITIVAGYLGVLVGMGVIELIGNNLKDYYIVNPYVDMGSVVFATAILIFSGVIAGYLPARRAARIKPIVALRDN